MIRLHGYWRSTAAYRVRIALNLKGVAYEQITYDLRRQEHQGEAYRAANPLALVPSLETDEGLFTESQAIIEWLEERYPSPPLLPSTAADRAIVRAMAAAIACDIHPLNNLRVLARLRADFATDEAQVSGWMTHWMHEGFAALEALVSKHGNGFAFGDSATMADAFLVPQIYSARRFGVDLTPFPRLIAADAAACALDAFARAHPERQPDAD